jgi:precorrin-6B methylase 2
LVSLRLLAKSSDNYRLAPGLNTVLTGNGAKSVLGMAQHQANCLRRWAELARVVKNGQPAKVGSSVRGPAGDQRSFIDAMHNISAPVAGKVIKAVRPLKFNHLLDVGGASGTWTMAFLLACPSARATLFDLPQVLPMARRRLTAAKLIKRVRLVAGDFLKDALPWGVDLVWVSAIVHQNSRVQNRTLFAKVLHALSPGGRIAIRDMVMEKDPAHPVAGALFAVNMLVATERGGTFTFDELREDLERAGFAGPAVVRRDQGMNSIVVAHKQN